MATTADGIIYPVAGDYIAPLNAHIQALAESTQNAIDAKVSSASVSYTPTFQNFTLGNGSVFARYSKIGPIVVDEIEITFGSTTAVTGSMFINSLPIAHRFVNAVKPCGFVIFSDLSPGNNFLGTPTIFDTNSLHVRTNVVSGVYSVLSNTTGNVPFAWAAGDKIFISTVRLAA
jgi:hypothetical protein